VEWIKILGSKAEALERVLPNVPQLVIIDSLRICVVRLGDDFFAVGDKCSHNGESLSKGKVNFIGEVICPWHGYRFNLKTGKCAESYPDIPTYPLRVSEEGFFIGL
jgi:nitrite reductase/ring-hydroxylating ferredoxin subunit